jgi:hypothetical protein
MRGMPLESSNITTQWHHKRVIRNYSISSADVTKQTILLADHLSREAGFRPPAAKVEVAPMWELVSLNTELLIQKEINRSPS